MPATAASLPFAGRCSRLLLSAFAYNGRPTPVSLCIQAFREYARHGGGADGMWYSGEPARPWADDSAFAGPRSPAPPARGGASGRGCAALPSCSCLRWWRGDGRIIRRSAACQPKKLCLLRCLVSVSSLDMSFHTLALLVVSIPIWFWQPTMTQNKGPLYRYCKMCPERDSFCCPAHLERRRQPNVSNEATYLDVTGNYVLMWPTEDSYPSRGCWAFVWCHGASTQSVRRFLTALSLILRLLLARYLAPPSLSGSLLAHCSRMVAVYPGGPPRRHGEDWHSEARQSGWSGGPSRSALSSGYPGACTALTNGASGGDGVAKGDGACHKSLRPRPVGPHTRPEGGPPPRGQDTRPRAVARPRPGQGTPALQDQWRHAPHPRRRAVAAQDSPY